MDDPVAEQQLLDYWRYAHNGESYGPVSGDEINAMLRSKQLPPTILVWREGMEGFVQVTTFAGLIQGVKVPIRMIADPEARRQAKIISNAKQNAVAMFVVFLLWLMGLSATIAGILQGEPDTAVGVGACFGPAGMLGGIYAAIYLPLRWKTLMSLPQSFLVMGLVGGVGLITLIAISITFGVFAVAVGL